MVGTETLSTPVTVLPPISFVPTVVFSGPGVTSGSGMAPGHRAISFGAGAASALGAGFGRRARLQGQATEHERGGRLRAHQNLPFTFTHCPHPVSTTSSACNRVLPLLLMLCGTSPR